MKITVDIARVLVHNTSAYNYVEVICKCLPDEQTGKPGVAKAKAAFRKHGGIMRMANAVQAGIHRNTLYAMRDAGVIEQLSRGLFRLADAPPLANPDLVTVARRVPPAWSASFQHSHCTI